MTRGPRGHTFHRKRATCAPASHRLGTDTTLSARLIRVSSRALGKRKAVRVYIYDTVEELREAASRFAPGVDFSEAAGTAQSYQRIRIEANGTETTIAAPYIIRLWRERLAAAVVTHELVHIAQQIYGDTLAADTLADEVMHASNEPFAYLVSDLVDRLVDRLYDLGYYGP